MTPPKPLLTTAEVVELLASLGVEVSQETVRRWSRQGSLRAVNAPLIGHKHFRREDVLALVDAGAA